MRRRKWVRKKSFALCGFYRPKGNNKLLISEVADVDARDEDVLDAFGRVEMSGRTPLHFALFGGHVEIAELLIASGADANANTYITGTSLHWAAAERKKEIVELLIEKGADVNAKDQKGKTPLDTAYGQTADLLRKHGAKTSEELDAAGNQTNSLHHLNA